MDLLTVAMHELGHLLGLADLHDADLEDDLMLATLAPNQTKLLPLSPPAVDALFSAGP